MPDIMLSIISGILTPEQHRLRTALEWVV